ncbi:MAG: TRAP transporter large permease, partial [Gammaproteobacteria bacterium]
MSDYILVAIPLFILVAQILLAGGVGRDLFAVGDVWLRHLPGGLAVAAIFSCAVFAAISGSSVATAATVGLVAIPEMTRRGYPRRLVLGALAAGGTLGILIPPSIPMILYGSITQQSIGALFSAGILPGILLTGLFAAYASFAVGRQVSREPSASWEERFGALRKAFWGLLTPVIIVGGLYAGIFTPTESAAVGVVYSLIITMLIYRSITWRDLPDILLKTVKDSTMILMIIVGALLFGRVLTVLRVPQEITALVTSQEMSKWLVLVAIIVLLTIMGMFLEVASVLLITIPILFPIISALGFDPIWFAVVFVIVMEMALITPPVGLN